jgi:hypothetical protein
MKAPKRGYRSPRTLRSRMDRIKTKTPQGALLELTRLTQEKMRLRDEAAHWERRLEEIRGRLQEIVEMETFLHSFIEPPGDEFGVGQQASRRLDRNPSSMPPEVNEVTISY